MKGIKFTKRSVYWIVVFAVLLGILLYNARLFFPSGNGGSRKWLAVFIFLIVILLLSLYYRLRVFSAEALGIPDPRRGRKPISLLEFLFCFLCFPAAWHLSLELIDNPAFRGIDWKHHALSVALCGCVFLFLFFLTRSLAVTLWAGSIFYFVWGCVEYYIVEFRGIPLMYCDLIDAGVAMEVAGEYSFTPTKKLLTVGILLFAACVVVLAKGDRFPPGGLRANIAGRVAAVCGIIAVGVIIGHSAGFTRFVGTMNAPLKSYRTAGTQLCFIQSVKNAQISPPEGYSAKAVEALLDTYLPKAEAYNSDPEGAAAALPGGKQPNIIAIMDESFSNLDVTGTKGLDEQVMPNYLALKENTIKGYAMVSTFGGGTGRSEFEFNTGDSMHAFPDNSSPYALFGTRMKSALASQLLQQGYRTVAIHPYKRVNYNRPRTYEAMGFQEYLSEEDFENPEYVRSYISDRTVFNRICDIAEETEEPLYAFTVTMQNHGAYDNASYEPKVLAGDGSTPEANQFVSLIRETDIAFQELLDRLSASGEPTIVVMFGDHLPSLPGGFYKSYNGFTKENGGEAERILYFRTPYVIWANYDIPEAEGEECSLNYLGGKVLTLAGSALTPFQLYQKELMEEVPAFSQRGWYGTDGERHPYGTDIETEKRITEYDALVYNQLIDRQNRCDAMFGIP